MLDADGDLALVQSKRSGAANFSTYATNFSYTSAGAVSSMQLGNGRWESTAFNERLQPTQIALGTTPNATNLLKLNFEYGKLNWDGSTLAGTNNGNVSKQTINTPNTGNTYGFVATQYYTYDALNRSEIASENLQPNDGSLMINGWRQNYSYDRYGNRRFIITGDSSTTTIPAGCADVVCNPQIDPNTNKLIGYTYDDAGNTRIDATGRGFSYDAENKQTEVRDGNNIVVGRYYYDGDGRRVKKVSATETTIFVYDAGGKLIAEYSNQSSQTPQISYLTSDHLGSPRIITDGSGNVTSRRDFQPFGEEVRTWYRVPNLGYAVDDDVRQKFTGYERDNESDLDFGQARYVNNSHGRFTSPDPYNPIVRRESFYSISLYAAQPQNWNKYSYAYNNPHRYVDRDGETPTVVTAAIGAVVGAVIGAGIETAKQAIFDDEFNYKKIGGAAVGGAIFGGVVGLTAGASLIYQVPALAIANGTGGIANRAISGDPSNPTFSATSIGIDAIAGGAGGYFAPLGTSRYLATTAATRNVTASSVETLLVSSPVPSILPTLTRPVVQNAIRSEVYHGYAQNLSNGIVRGGSKSATTGFLNFLVDFNIARPVQSAPTVERVYSNGRGPNGQGVKITSSQCSERTDGKGQMCFRILD